MSEAHLNRVLSLINEPALKVYDDYLAGDQAIAFLPPDVLAEVGDRLPEMVIAIPMVVIGSIEERLDVNGFRLSRDQDADEQLLDIWQGNDLDEWSQILHMEALTHGISFVTVWAGDDPAIPRIALESARQFAVEYAPGTRVVQAAAKTWVDVAEDGSPLTRAVLYLPDRIEHYSHPGALGVGITGSSPLWTPPLAALGSRWTLNDVVPNPLGEVPVVPFVNRPRLGDLSGQSELKPIIPLTNAVNKLAVDMMVTSEYHAEPRRTATGLQIPKEAVANARLAEEARAKWDQARKGKTLLGGVGVQFGQLSAASLDNFIGAIELCLRMVAMTGKLPPDYVGATTANPASAAALRASEAKLVRLAERKQRTFGGSWERVMRLALKVRDGSVDPTTRSMETIWAHPGTETLAEDADAVQKLTSGDRPVLSMRAGRERLGLTPAQIARIEEEETEARNLAVTADVQARVEQARRLQETDGLSQSAALAAVGLLAAATAASAAPAAPTTT